MKIVEKTQPGFDISMPVLLSRSQPRLAIFPVSLLISASIVFDAIRNTDRQHFPHTTHAVPCAGFPLFLRGNMNHDNQCLAVRIRVFCQQNNRTPASFVACQALRCADFRADRNIVMLKRDRCRAAPIPVRRGCRANCQNWLEKPMPCSDLLRSHNNAERAVVFSSTEIKASSSKVRLR